MRVEGVELQFHLFLTSALNEGEPSASWLRPFIHFILLSY